MRGLLDVAGYLLGCRTLLFHRRSNGRRYLRHPADGVADLLNRSHRILRGGLDSADLLTDLAGRLRGLLGQGFHLRRHHRETAAGFASPRRLDRGIQGQQIGLPGNGVDQLDHVADAGCRLRQFTDTVVGFLRLNHRFVGDPGRFLDLTADLVDRRGHLLTRRTNRLHVGGGFLRRCRDHRRKFLRPLGCHRQCIRGRFQLAGGRRYHLDDFTDRAFECVGELVHIRLAQL